MLRKRWMILAVAVVTATRTAYGMKENMATWITQEQPDKQQDTKEQAVKAQTPEQKEIGSYPEKNVTLIIPFSVGGRTDVLMRMAGAKVKKVAGHVFIINNTPGNGGAVGTAELAKATSDGYIIVGASVYDVLGFTLLGGDSVKYAEVDFECICDVNVGGEILIASPSMGLELIEGVIEFVQEHPGELTVSTSSITHNLLLGILEDQLGMEVTNIAYSGGGGSFNALMGSHVDVALIGKRFASQAEGTDFRVLCMMASEETASLPGVPAFCNVYSEARPPMGSRLIIAPKDVPEDVAERLELLIKETTDTGEFRNKMAESGDLHQFATGEEVEVALTGAGKTLKAAVGGNPAVFGLE